MNVYTVPRHLRPHQAASRPRPPKWTELAVCTEVGTELFYPEDGVSTADPATAVCRSCEVRLTCLRDALTRPGERGVWGGFPERARARVASEHAAGKSLEDIIADDDARYYDRIERSAVLAEAAAERQLAQQRRKRADALAAITDPPAQPREKAA